MAALAPITNETPAWDVLDPFPESHARARQTKSGNPLSKSLTYSYDSVGNRRSLDAPDSGRFSYVYDAAEQLSSVLNPFSELTTFSYDIAGRRTVQRYSNGTRASIIYDTANNVTQFHNRTSTGTAITTNDYKYDNVGNRTGMLEASGDRLTWTYDNGDQLKSERRSGASGYANTFTYDGVGNRTLKNAGATRTTFSYDVADQLVYSQAVAGRTSYVYDNAGNQQIERPPTGSRTTTVWDNENRPTLYRLPDTSLVTMSYNGNNRRVTKQSSTETVKFVWDPVADAYLAEFNGSNVLQATYSHEPVQFGRTLSQRRSTTSSWYHTDALGSTQALSNSSQITSDTYLYDAWGNPITSTGTTVNPFRWVGNVGYYFDSDTGLYYIRARTYQPTIARWTSVDPLFYMLAKAGALGAFTKNPTGYRGGLNVYRYARSCPIHFVDPMGTWDLLPGEEPDWQYPIWEDPDDYEIEQNFHDIYDCDSWECILAKAFLGADGIRLGTATMKRVAGKLKDFIKDVHVPTPNCSGGRDDGVHVIPIEFSQVVDYRIEPIGGTTLPGVPIGVGDPQSLDLILGNAKTTCRGFLVYDMDCCTCDGQGKIEMKCQVTDVFDFSPGPNRSPIYNYSARLWQQTMGGRLSEPKLYGQVEFNDSFKMKASGCDE